MGLAVNMQTIEYMEVTENPTDTKMLKIEDREYERIKVLKYLGAILTEDNEVTTVTNQRIITANKTSYGLK
jgi:hypothetical protein